MDGLSKATARIRMAFESGMRMTTAQGNRIGQTVDFRKIVSRLKQDGLDIKSFWNEQDGRRWKTYYLQQPLNKKGTRMDRIGQPELGL